MIGCCGRKISLRAAVILLGLVSGAMLMTPQPARTQGLFDLFNRMFGGWRLQPSEPPRERIDSSGPVAYCVRLCDGRYFPMPKNAGAPSSSPDKICSALCPASATKIYTGGAIDEASAEDGSTYSKLANAFAYRERMVPDCTCTGRESGGTAAIDIHSDPTLRPGDIVATQAGLVVFKGSKRLPYQTSDFVPVENYKGLPAGVRKTLTELKVASGRDDAAGNIARAATSVPVPEPRATPVAEFLPTIAFPIF